MGGSDLLSPSDDDAMGDAPANAATSAASSSAPGRANVATSRRPPSRRTQRAQQPASARRARRGGGRRLEEAGERKWLRGEAGAAGGALLMVGKGCFVALVVGAQSDRSTAQKTSKNLLF